MAKQRFGPMFESLKGLVTPPEPPAARTEAFSPPDAHAGLPAVDARASFMLGQGVEPPVVGPVSPHADLWMLGPEPTYQRRIAFTESVGARFGDLGLTSRFCLDRWSESPAGFRWTLDPAAPPDVTLSARAHDLLAGTFARTQTGLGKLAVAEYGGDLDRAIIHAINEQMDMLGLDRYIPDEPQETW